MLCYNSTTTEAHQFLFSGLTLNRTLACVVFLSIGISHLCFFTVESDSGASVPSPEVFQDALSKKQRRPQDDDRRRKDQGPPVSNHLG